ADGSSRGPEGRNRRADVGPLAPLQAGVPAAGRRTARPHCPHGGGPAQQHHECRREQVEEVPQLEERGDRLESRPIDSGIDTPVAGEHRAGRTARRNRITVGPRPTPIPPEPVMTPTAMLGRLSRIAGRPGRADCYGPVTALVAPGEPFDPAAAGRCRLCGRPHILEVEEEIVSREEVAEPPYESGG